MKISPLKTTLAPLASLRAASLTRQMLSFARQMVLRPQPVNLNAVIDEVVGLLNEHFSVVTEAAYRHDGTIFSMAGDNLLVGFNVPVPQVDAAERAVDVGLHLAPLGALAARLVDIVDDDDARGGDAHDEIPPAEEARPVPLDRAVLRADQAGEIGRAHV